MNKFIWIFTIFIFCNKSGYSQSYPAPKSYVAYRAIGSVEVDGQANERSWQEVPFSEDFVDIEGIKKPKYQTNVKIIWDDAYVYFYAKMEEPHIWSTLKQRDTIIFYNNDFEIFIDPDGDTHNYFEFEVNALNTVWDLFLVKPYREPAPVVDNWKIRGLKSAVHIEGSINDPSDEDDFWSIEVAMPWEVLEEANVHGDTHENKFWRINFSRVNWNFQLENEKYSREKDTNNEFLPEYNWVWSPQWVINMHEPEKWGYVYFSSAKAGEEKVFTIPEDERLKWLLYDLYRAQKDYIQKNGEWASSIADLQVQSKCINGTEVRLDLELHQSGWNISITSPYTGKNYLIKEDGKFIEPKNQSL